MTTDYKNLSLREKKKIVAEMFPHDWAARGLISAINRQMYSHTESQVQEALLQHDQLETLLKLHRELYEIYNYKVKLSIEVDCEVTFNDDIFLAQVTETPLGGVWWDDYLSSLVEEDPEIKKKLDELATVQKTYNKLIENIADELEVEYSDVANCIEIVATIVATQKEKEKS